MKNKETLVRIYNLLLKYADYLFLIIFVSLPIFIGISYYPIFKWDEARYAINSYEMWENHNYIVPFFNGSADLMNNKPPMLMWLQIFFANIFGHNEISVRLPSAFAALFTCLFMYYFLVEKLKVRKLIGFLSCIGLVGVQGYMMNHVVRTGEFDGLLTFFTTLYVLFYFLHLNESKKSHIIIFIMAITAAFFVKGLSGLIPAAGLIVFSIISGRSSQIFANKDLRKGLIYFLSIVAIYYFIREYMSPGYLQLVLSNELGIGDKAIQGNEGTQESFFYYFTLIFKEQAGVIIVLLALFNIIYSFYNKNKYLSQFGQYVGIVVVSFLVVSSISKTKLPWNIAPSLPLITISSVLGFYQLILLYCKKYNKNVGFYLILLSLIIFVPNYLKELYYSLNKEKVSTKEPNYNILKYMKGVLNKNYSYEPQYSVLIKESYGAEVEYYQRLLLDEGMQIKTYNLLFDKGKPEFLVVGDPLLLDEIKKIYKVIPVKQINNIHFIKTDIIQPAEELKDYNLNAYSYNEYGIKVVPHKSDKRKVVVVVKKGIFNKDFPLSYHYVEKVEGQEKFQVNDIGIWAGRDADSISYTIMNHNGEFLRVAIGQNFGNGKSWEQWFGR